MITATLNPADAQSTLSWKSSNKKIATVDSKGLVSPKGEGTATITVTTANKKSASVKVKVSDPYKPTGIPLIKRGRLNFPRKRSLRS